MFSHCAANNNQRDMESFEFTGDVFPPSPNSEVPAQAFRQLRQDEMHNNSFSTTTGDHEGMHQTVSRPDTSVTSYDFNDRHVSASSAAQHQQMPTICLPDYNSSSWDDHSHFQEEAESRPSGNQKMWPSLDPNNSSQPPLPSQTNGMASTSFPLRINRPHTEAHPYFRGNQTVKAQTPATTGAANNDRKTLPASLRQLLQLLKSSMNESQKSIEVVAILRKNPKLMAAFIKQRNMLANKANPPCVVTNPQQQAGVSNGNSTTIATEETQQVTGNFCSTTQQRMMTGGTMIVAQLPPESSRYSDFPATIEQQSTNQLENQVVASSSGQAPHLETRSSAGSPVHINQCSRSAIHLPPNQENAGGHDIGKRVDLSGIANRVADEPVASQLAVARQLIMQAAISAAADGATNFSQMLNDQTHNIEHVMKTHCPTFPHEQTQMEAISSLLTPSVNSKLSAPKIPTCSICLDQLVSTVVFPCRHLFCETCAPKIKKCGFCREVIEARHRVYF